MGLRSLILVVGLLSAVAYPSVAQDHGDHLSPYAGQERRSIKSLSQSRIDDLLAGRGAGYAKAAELNGVPGPAHILEMSSEIGLSVSQERQIRAAFDRMQHHAAALGRELVDLERALNAAFAAMTVTPENLKSLLGDIARVEADLRYAHLAAHLETPAILSPEQIRTYNRLRGYGDDPCDSVPAGHDAAMWKRHNNCTE